MKKNKGQVIVEFALILPLFLLIMYGIIYSGMMFHDYSTISNIARSSAREAALSDSSKYGEIAVRYEGLLGNLMTSFYTKNGDNAIVIQQITDDEGNKSVCSTITMKLDVHGYFVDMILPPTFGVQYFMRSEPTSSSPSGGL